MPLGVPLAHWMLKAGSCVIRSETELVTKSRWVEPRVLMDHGFRWRWPELAGALSDLEDRRGVKQFFATPSKRAVGARAWTGERTLRTS